MTSITEAQDLPALPAVIQSREQCKEYWAVCGEAAEQRMLASHACNRSYFDHDHNRITSNHDWTRRIRDTTYPSCGDEVMYTPPQCDGDAQAYCFIKRGCDENRKICMDRAAQAEASNEKARGLAVVLRVTNPIVDSYNERAPAVVEEIAASVKPKRSPEAKLYKVQSRIELAQTIFKALSYSSSAEDRLSAFTDLGVEGLAPAFRENSLSKLLTQIAADTIIHRQLESMAELEMNFSQFDKLLFGTPEFDPYASSRESYKLIQSSPPDPKDVFALLADASPMAHKGKSVSKSRHVHNASIAQLEAQLAQQIYDQAYREETARLEEQDRQRLIDQQEAQRLAEERAEARASRERAAEERAARTADLRERAYLRQMEEEREAEEEEAEADRRDRSRSTLSESIGSILDTYTKSKRSSSGTSSGSSCSQRGGYPAGDGSCCFGIVTASGACRSETVR